MKQSLIHWYILKYSFIFYNYVEVKVWVKGIPQHESKSEVFHCSVPLSVKGLSGCKTVPYFTSPYMVTELLFLSAQSNILSIFFNINSVTETADVSSY
jgi:hypothetical protein